MRRFFVFIAVAVAAGLLLSGALFRGGEFPGLLRKTGAIILGAVSDMFGQSDGGSQIVAELPFERGAHEIASPVPLPSLPAKPPKKRASAPAASPVFPAAVPAENPVSAAGPTPAAVAETEPAPCDFGRSGEAVHKALINEVAWMGSPARQGESAAEAGNREWIELKNNLGRDLSLAGWQLMDAEEKLRVVFSPSDRIALGGYFLLARGGAEAAPGVPADKAYSGALANGGMRVKLFDEACGLVDELDASRGWPGGDNETKQTLERTPENFGWHTSIFPGGTPGAENAHLGSFWAEPPPSPARTAAAPPAPSPPLSAGETPAVSAGRVIITEVMAGAENDADSEFVELYNAGDAPADLTGWVAKKRSASGAEHPLVAAARLEGKSIPPHRHFLLANEGGYRGAKAADAAWATSNTLAYTSNAVVLYDAAGARADEAAWAEIPKGGSYARDSIPGAPFSVQTVPAPENSSDS